MHPVEHKGHGEQVAVLETDDVPLVVGRGFVGINVGEEAEGEDYYAHVDPGERGGDVDDGGHEFVFVLGFDEGASEGHEYVAGVVDDQDHGACGDFVAHHRKEDESGCHEVVQQVLVELPLRLALYYDHLEDREEVHAQLDHEVHLQVVGRTRGPVGVLLVDLCALAATAGDAGEPVLVPEEEVGEDGGEGVEDGVETELEHRVHLVDALLPLVLVVQDRLDLVLHQRVVGVLHHKNSREPHRAPDQRIHREDVVALLHAVFSKVQEALDAEGEDQRQHDVYVLEDLLRSDHLLPTTAPVHSCNFAVVGHIKQNQINTLPPPLIPPQNHILLSQTTIHPHRISRHRFPRDIVCFAQLPKLTLKASLIMLYLLIIKLRSTSHCSFQQLAKVFSGVFWLFMGLRIFSTDDGMMIIIEVCKVVKGI